MQRKKLLFSVLIVFELLLAGCNGQKTSSSNTNGNSNNNSIITSSNEEKKIAKNNDYANPCLPIVDDEKRATYMADPYVIRDDEGTYYLYCTQTDVYESKDALASVFKRGPIFSSIDGVNWSYAGNVFQDYNPTWGTSGAGVWAPTVCKVGDYYNYYYSLSTGGDTNPGIGVARSLSPIGPFEHYGKLFNSEEIGVINSIDPYVFYDNDKLYIAWGSFGGLITIAELESDGLSLKGGLETQYQEKVAIAGYEVFESNNYEGTIILKRNGKYYLFLSTGTCLSGTNSTYHVVVATSDNLFGPYKDSKGKDMFGPNRGDYVVAPSRTGAMGVGHNGFFEDDAGEIWMVYHGYDTTSVEHSDWRVTYVDKLLWDEETGLPYIENRKASNHVTLPGPYIKTLEEN